MVSLLESIQINGRTGLDVFINTWCENADTLQGFWTPRMHTLALIDMFQCEHPGLQQLMVKGDLIIKPETRNGEPYPLFSTVAALTPCAKSS